ncbi:transport protein Avl9-domain-containing protein [Scheffersomyces xylosifermentans]|uniref:transport protein Avl9-domain-containing protein n=1 Tax=Scheffersomyces xylosifermentans TaxID=1304137 RepID=UPI00315CCFD7
MDDEPKSPSESPENTNSWSHQAVTQSSSLPPPDENGIRPIRLAKRHENRSSTSSNTSSTHSRASSTSASRSSTDEFQFRPIRLGSTSHSSATSTTRSQSNRASFHSFNTLVKPEEHNHNQHSGSTSSTASSTTINSNHSVVNQHQRTPSATSTDASISSATLASAPTSVVASPSKVNKRKSIQIKNLPIATSPLKNNYTLAATASGRQIDDMIFAICVVDFHHQRGPEVQWWKSNYHSDYSLELFKNLPFQALPDGSHLFEETFSNFNLVYDFESRSSIDCLQDLNEYQGDPRHLKTLFGCSCVRQVKTSDLSQEERDRNKDITRSIVQKAIVIIVRKQPIFTKIKEKLSIVTKSYFQQDSFQNVEILENLFDNLNSSYKLVGNELEETTKLSYEVSEQQKFVAKEEEYFVNLNLKNTILKFKANFLTIFKSLLLDKKILIFSNNGLEMLTQFQNNLISLIPNLINNLDNSGCPLIDYVETNGPLTKPNSLNTTSRKSMLRFFGLPLQIFNTKNSFWNPYLPLQQLDELSVDSFMVGCSNLIFVNQAANFEIDLLINLDTNEISFPCGKSEDLHLSKDDKKFINNLIHNIENEREEEYLGNDDYIRYQFEDYLNSLIATMRYAQYKDKFLQPPPGFANGDSNLGDLSLFNSKFIDSWKLSYNYRIWNSMADEFIFNFMDPKHLAVEYPEQHGNYNISSFFSGFKFKTAAPEQTNTNDPKPQKFITDDKREETAPKTPENEDFEHVESSSESEPVAKKVSSWTVGWGFKKT